MILLFFYLFVCLFVLILNACLIPDRYKYALGVSIACLLDVRRTVLKI